MNDQFNEMLGVLAHEMRTPISAILGYQELLADGVFGTIDERGREPLERIAYSARQLLNLIDGVQEVSLPAEKRLEVDAQPFDPAPILRECVENALLDATGRNVRLDSSLADPLPQIHGDPDRFCRAVDLALSAAIKTSHGATLAIGATAQQAEVQITISGTGLQPDRDNPDLVVENGAAVGPRLTGAALRLAIVRHLAKQMDGDIGMQRRDGSTTLLLNLPVANSPDLL